MGPALRDRRAVQGGGGTSPWPVHGLERVASCPACGAAERELLHGGLTDRLFRCAPGTWTLLRCVGCGSAYLDPRPTEDSILLAYSDYYTHDDAVGRPVVPLQGLRDSLANGYLNARYATRLQPASRLGPAASALFPLRRAKSDREVHLHRPRAALARAHELLRPGGFLWLATPNLSSA